MSDHRERAVWPTNIRERLHVGPEHVRKTTPVAMPKVHYHIWIERGWSGTLSPRLASLEAANAELRDLLRELGDPEVNAGSSFPFTQVFIHVPDSEHPKAEQGQWLNAVMRQCDGRPAGAHQCNDTEVWR